MEADISSIYSIQSSESQGTHIFSIQDALLESVAPNALSIESFDFQNFFDDNSSGERFLYPTAFDNILLSGDGFSDLELQTSLPPTREFEYQPL